MLQLYFRFEYNGLVYPVHYCLLACLPYDGIQIAWSEAELVGIEGDIALRFAMSVDQGDESLENIFLMC